MDDDAKEFILKVIIPRDEKSDEYTVYLFNTEEKILLPLSTGRWASESILLAKQGKLQVRPHVHDTFRRAVLSLGGEVVGVTIYKVIGDTFYAYLRISRGDEIFDIDAKPTDAISMALRCGVPIYVNDYVCDVAGIKVTRELLERSLEI